MPVKSRRKSGTTGPEIRHKDTESERQPPDVVQLLLPGALDFHKARKDIQKVQPLGEDKTRTALNRQGGTVKVLPSEYPRKHGPLPGEGSPGPMFVPIFVYRWRDRWRRFRSSWSYHVGKWRKTFEEDNRRAGGF